MKQNIIFNKNGRGYLSPRINLSKKMLDKLGINENNKTVDVSLKNDRIIIRKEGVQDEKIIDCIQAIENSISKDKIKEKIEELNKKANEYEENEKDIGFKTFWHNKLLKVTHQKWILEEILK